MAQKIRLPLLNDFYNQYLIDHDANALGNRVLQKYGIGTLERLASEGKRMTRRAAVLALGLVADYESNAVLGRAMVDEDRGVRTIAENGIRALWCRDGSPKQQRHLTAQHRTIGPHRVLARGHIGGLEFIQGRHQRFGPHRLHRAKGRRRRITATPRRSPGGAFHSSYQRRF